MEEGIARCWEIAYIIVPPQYNDSPAIPFTTGLLVAETLYDPTRDEDLRQFARIASIIDDWTDHDDYWADRLLERVTSHNWVFIVPRESLGIALGGTHIATFNEKAWSWGTDVVDDEECCCDEISNGPSDCDGAMVDTLLHDITSAEQWTEDLYTITVKWMQNRIFMKDTGTESSTE